MSKNLSAVAVTEFDSMVKHAYQGMGLLKNCVTLRNNVVGDTYKFRRMGKGLANQKSTSDLVTPMDVGHEFKTAGGSHDFDLSAPFPETAHQVRDLIGGDTAAHGHQDTFSLQISHGLSVFQ